MSIGLLVLIINVVMWWGLFNQAPRPGYKALFFLLALMNSWILLERVKVFTTGFEHQSVSSTVDQVKDATPKFHAIKVQ